MSHHPPISALYVTNRKDGFTLSATILAKSKFYGKYIQNHRAFKVWLFDFISFWFFFFFCFFFFGKKSWTFSGTLLTLIFFHLCVLLGNSLSALLDGSARLTLLPRGEDYLITMPYAHCKGILLGTLTMEMGGEANTLQLFSRVVLWVPIRTASKQIFFRVLDKSLEWGATGGGEERGECLLLTMWMLYSFWRCLTCITRWSALNHNVFSDGLMYHELSTQSLYDYLSFEWIPSMLIWSPAMDWTDPYFQGPVDSIKTINLV